MTRPFIDEKQTYALVKYITSDLTAERSPVCLKANSFRSPLHHTVKFESEIIHKLYPECLSYRHVNFLSFSAPCC